MFNVGAGEMMAILLVALVVLGPERLPKAMNQLGRYVGQLRQLSNGFQDELRRAIDVDNAPFRPGEESHPVPPVDEVKVLGSGPLPDDAGGSSDDGGVTSADEGADAPLAPADAPPPADGTHRADGPAADDPTPGNDAGDPAAEVHVDGRAPRLRAVTDPEDRAAG
ncbi:MAG: twin-arginine translocase subunit TatB [Acidimicrobiales bacterium]|nr:twin-arginine translocase subunit TatB [Acidimicrobiales bacterium]